MNQPKHEESNIDLKFEDSKTSWKEIDNSSDSDNYIKTPRTATEIISSEDSVVELFETYRKWFTATLYLFLCFAILRLIYTLFGLSHSNLYFMIGVFFAIVSIICYSFGIYIKSTVSYKWMRAFQAIIAISFVIQVISAVATSWDNDYDDGAEIKTFAIWLAVARGSIIIGLLVFWVYCLNKYRHFLEINSKVLEKYSNAT